MNNVNHRNLMGFQGYALDIAERLSIEEGVHHRGSGMSSAKGIEKKLEPAYVLPKHDLTDAQIAGLKARIANLHEAVVVDSL